MKDDETSDGNGKPCEPDDQCARADAARKGSPFLNTAQTAHYLGLSRRTLEEMRERGEGPPCRKHGRQVRYHIAEVEAWSLANRCNFNAEDASDDEPDA
jgi:excisionase family DNA binding protein